MKTALVRALPTAAIIMSLSLTGAAAASAGVDAHKTGVEAAETANIQMLSTLDAQKLSTINAQIVKVGGRQIPSGSVAFGFNESGDAVAVNAQGGKTVLESASKMDAEIDAAISSQKVTTGTARASAAADKGVVSGLAATIAGCAGGVIGYDAILSILEKRVSYWALVKFLGGKIGPGLAISCIAGAGGALATYMGW